jgi:quercetin dioxygenase-like cupin family protein
MLNGMEKRVVQNDVILARNGDWHGLENDTDENLVILVFEGKVDG